MLDTLPVSAIVVAGGLGIRMSGEIPKQFMQLKGKPVVQWSLECFNQIDEVDNIILVLPEGWVDEGRDKLISFDPIKPFAIVPGGSSRQESVAAGIASLENNKGWVVIHDGARPAVTPELVIKMLNGARQSGNAVCAVPSHDTLVRVVNGKMVGHVDRSEIFRIQTPQIFPIDVMQKAIANAREKSVVGTDDASLVREIGLEINLVSGSELNVKITRPEDLDILEALL